MKSTKLKAAAITTASTIVAAAPRLANACATCGLTDGDAGFHAYKASVLFMLATPYFAFGAIGGITYYVYRRSQRQNNENGSSTVDRR